ncbi:hypothetical protein KGG72_gp69 [Streptomyces phage Salutena]|uniref:Uncharacterized protein n=1 Tax=Streptomyces phage Salutena TaxID=2767576 RepID=A0A7S6R8Q7_9CAUD|nr:hypothetical protein KGG72_gp69 [Streptomyces phage Salutena]QOV06199.1 hypothetical protein CPT_Salutena_069 [Streptomyces phage Salutena]
MIMRHLMDRITDENVQDIIDTAAYGGITYWATEPTDEEFAGLPEGKEYTIVEGIDDTAFGGDREVDSVNYLSKDDVRLAFAKLLDPGQEYVNRELHGYILDAWRDRTDNDGIDTGHIDAGAADVIVQVAIFDEVRYG